MKLSSTILLLGIILRLQAQDVYFKSVDVEMANDSIAAFVDSASDVSIRFSQHSYWSSRSDTTTRPNLNNYYLYLYKDSTDRSFAIIVTPYFIFGPYQREFPAIDFFKLNQFALLNTNLRPDERDLVVDTAYFREYNLPLNDTTKWFAAHYPQRGKIIDGTNNTVVLTNGVRTIKIGCDTRLIDPKDFYYEYNSAMPFYTLLLLLEHDWERVKGAIEWDIELAQQGILTEQERIQWILKQIPSRQKELKELKKELKQELKELKK